MATCGLLGINRQLYYRRVEAAGRKRQTATVVVQMVGDIRLRMPRVGGLKLYHLLKDRLRPLRVGRDRLFSILRANNLLIEPKKSYHVTTDSHHRFRKHKNIVQNLTPDRPEQLWVADITYVGNRTNPMYLSLVTDAYSKKIVGYDVSNTLETKACLKALEMAVGNRMYRGEPLIHHSDRGFQYCSGDYQRALGENRLRCSMTESYDPYANAVAERVNGILKQEFIGTNEQVNIKTMRDLVCNSIKIYNHERPHYSCFMQTPQEMHTQRKVKIRTYKNKNPVNKCQLDSIN